MNARAETLERAAGPSAAEAQLPASGGGKLINIDNGGTLTDFCVIDGGKVYRTKSVTTPYDLSKCFFDGLRKASRLIFAPHGNANSLRVWLKSPFSGPYNPLQWSINPPGDANCGYERRKIAPR